MLATSPANSHAHLWDDKSALHFFSRKGNGSMRYRPVGDSGLLVSVAGLGCNNFGRRLDADQARAVVDALSPAAANWGGPPELAT
jgi:hypothetical protein